MTNHPLLWTVAAACLFLGALPLSVSAQTPTVVVYASADQEDAADVLAAFEKATGIKVMPVYDTESTKTVGMVQRIISEGAAPKADVFWNNEAAQTVRLKKLGLLAAYASPGAATIPVEFKDAGGMWCGFGARARVIIWNTLLAQERDVPTRVVDLADAKWRGRGVMARPLTGTTLTHAAVLYTTRGLPETDAWFTRLMGNDIQLEGGNAQVAREVGQGARPFGLTDTDDAHSSELNGRPTKIIYPDQGPDDPGVLLIPNTVMMLRGAPHPETAQKLIDYLLSPANEQVLAAGRTAQVPLHPGVPHPAYVKAADQLKVMPVDWNAVGDTLAAQTDHLRARFEVTATRSGGFSGIDNSPSESRPATSTMILGALIVLGIVAAVLGWRRRGDSAGDGAS